MGRVVLGADEPGAVWRRGWLDMVSVRNGNGGRRVRVPAAMSWGARRQPVKLLAELGSSGGKNEKSRRGGRWHRNEGALEAWPIPADDESRREQRALGLKWTSVNKAALHVRW